MNSKFIRIVLVGMFLILTFTRAMSIGDSTNNYNELWTTAGVGGSTLFTPPDVFGFWNTDYTYGFFAGTGVFHHFGTRWAVGSGIFFRQIGSWYWDNELVHPELIGAAAFKSLDSRIFMNYLTIPLMAKVEGGGRKVKFGISMGISGSFLLNATERVNEGPLFNPSEKNYRNNATSGFNRMDLSSVAEVEATIPVGSRHRLGIGARASIGLLDVVDDYRFIYPASTTQIFSGQINWYYRLRR